MKNNLFRLVILVFLNVLVCNALATDYVSSVRSYQEGKNIIITYELSKQSNISVSVSTDGGKTYKTLSSINGDFGSNVKPGSRKIVWDVLSEYENFKFFEVCFKVESNFYNGHEYVDLGLPSGTLWATCNVGASEPEEYGDYFAWGETSAKSRYTGSNYTYHNYPQTLPLVKDVANRYWGHGWRMPTKEEQDELRNSSYTTWIWTLRDGINGYKITSKLNGNSIFLPAAGRRIDSVLEYEGNLGYYWSSSSKNKLGEAYYLSLSSRALDWYYTGCYKGLSVRPVLNK